MRGPCASVMLTPYCRPTSGTCLCGRLGMAILAPTMSPSRCWPTPRGRRGGPAASMTRSAPATSSTRWPWVSCWFPGRGHHVAGYVGATRLAITVAACWLAQPWRADTLLARLLSGCVEHVSQPHERSVLEGRELALKVCQAMARRELSVAQRADLRRIVLLLAADTEHHPDLARRLLLHALPEAGCQPGCRRHARALHAALALPLHSPPQWVRPDPSRPGAYAAKPHRAARHNRRPHRAATVVPPRTARRMPNGASFVGGCAVYGKRPDCRTVSWRHEWAFAAAHALSPRSSWDCGGSTTVSWQRASPPGRSPSASDCSPPDLSRRRRI
jgi:hypothetical protein